MNDIEESLRELLLLASNGDGQANPGFLPRRSVHLRAYFRRRLAAFPDDVEDLVQETLLALHNQRHTYRPSERLTPWLYAIARYKLVDSLRAHSPRRAVEEPIDDETADSAFFAQDTNASEARRDLLKLLETLPDRFRLPLVQVKLEGLTVVEAALRLNMSESAVKIGIHRGLKVLARRVRPNS